jgi:hypothetical protein
MNNLDNAKLNNNFEIEYLHPKIWVFKKAFTQSIDMFKYFENTFSDDWKNWYTFGKSLALQTPSSVFKDFPIEQEWYDNITKPVEDNKYLKEFLTLFYYTTKEYCKKLQVTQENWLFSPGDIAKYNADSTIDGNRAMNYHTDYQQEKSLEPGSKFQTTCLFYLNDDYDGGEICFKIFNEDYSAVTERIEYKPSAGDIVIFPSKSPFYHAVKVAKNNDKYIIRSYWRYLYDGDPEYLKEKSNYSEEDWKNILKEKYKKAYDIVNDKVNIDSINDPFYG